MATYEDIKGYEGIYQVSPEGIVFSITNQRAKSIEISKNGYVRVNLFKNGKGKHHLVHRLVADAFIPNPHNYEFVNHKDGNKQNNDISNLEWCDASFNMKHAYENKLIKMRTTKVIQYSKNFEEIKVWDSIAEASKELGINHANIVTVCRQNTNRKYAGGYIWRYL